MNIKRKKTIYELVFKRAFDIVFSLIGIIILTPVFLIVALMVIIKLSSPIIFRQKRIGKNGKVFTIYKFRSMENIKDENGYYLADEKRLTKFGRKLRSSSLDELPQLFNILKGNMSIIGPRPHVESYLNFYDEKQRQRHNIRPGLTGLSQVNGRNKLSWEEEFFYDLKYIEKITFWQDFKIFFKTFIVVAKGEKLTIDDLEKVETFGDFIKRKKDDI